MGAALVLDLFPELVEEGIHVLEKFAERFATTEVEPGEAGFEICDLFEMAGPGLVDGFKANRPFGIAGVLGGVFHHFVAGLKKGVALAFDDSFVFVKEEAGVEMAALGAALEHVAIG